MAIQLLLNGLAVGSVYALIATGFALIFSILKFSNFSHGALMTLSAFVGYFVSAGTGWSLIPVLIVSMLVGGLIGLFGEFVAFRRITKRNSATFYYFVSSITLGTFYESIVTIIVGAGYFVYPMFFSKPAIWIGNFVIQTSSVVMLGISAIVLIILVFVLQKTKMGRALRAVSYDRDTAYLMGIDVFKTISIAFFISGALGALAGVFLGIYNYTLTAQLGNLVVKGFIASVIGGLGSISGAVFGAVLLGLLETILIFFIGSGYAPVATFLIMILFLFIRPQGIAGKSVQEKA
ncbi:branched-chain amino acid ABC transporter permease [Anaerocolumna aminovalerica]|uniref:Branched-chain amino acid transport system permease protein n=1 Tax=Anaerocolumna aminovalerica TaxID=1527 RepID=A0A1I5EHX4_9FIRM|nr:branched-chain amino acid ABC transporter permease [Anaerocolumna aminovalerica]SFO11010.1 branched-chain amino acid transport system permease protein [Anaerocolumna aminovalerica]